MLPISNVTQHSVRYSLLDWVLLTLQNFEDELLLDKQQKVYDFLVCVFAKMNCLTGEFKICKMTERERERERESESYPDFDHIHLCKLECMKIFIEKQKL